MSNAVTFTVYGMPAPQGSGRPITYRRSAAKGGGIGARVISTTPKLMAWRQEVGRAASVVMRGRSVWLGAIRIAVVFALPRPKKLMRPAHTVKPDIDKIARGLLDGMTGIVYRDDAQVVRLEVSKIYADVGQAPHARVTLSLAEPTLYQTEITA